MEGLNKVAGVQDPVPSSFPPPPPIPHHEQDVESQATHSLASRPSRSSLPVNRRPSRRTLNEQSSQPSLHQQEAFTAARDSGESAFPETDADISWGPRHPCFPHPNPHVPLDSPEYMSTRIVRVQRDWLVAGDLYPAIQNLYPEILIGYVSEDEFRSIVETTNTLLKDAFNPWTGNNWLDAILGIATGFFWDNTGMTAAKRKVTQMEKWFDEWNRNAQQQAKDARLIAPRRTGFLSLDIQIPDPLLDEPVLVDSASSTHAPVRA